MAAPYIPSQDSALDIWAQNFASLITASPTTYGLDAPSALLIQTAADDYHAAYLLGGLTAPPHPTPVNPATRTPVTVAAKNTAKLAGIGLWRTYAAQVRLDPGVSNSDKTALGLNLPNNTPSPIPAPVSWPIISQLSSGPLTTILTYKDSLTGVGKAKAPGAIQALMFASFGTTVVTDPTLLEFFLAITKVPTQLDFDSANAGKIVSLAARWITRTGLLGPFGPIISSTVIGA